MTTVLHRALWHLFLRVAPSAFPSCAYLLRHLPGGVQDVACELFIAHYERGETIPTSADNIPHIGNELQDAIFAALVKCCDEQIAMYGGLGYYRQYLTQPDAFPAESRKCIHDFVVNLFQLAVEDAFRHDGSQLVEIIKQDNGTRTH